jgi:hypothetical protein
MGNRGPNYDLPGIISIASSCREAILAEKHPLVLSVEECRLSMTALSYGNDRVQPLQLLIDAAARPDSAPV